MPLWPFHRKKRRESAYVPVTTDQPPMTEPDHEPSAPIDVNSMPSNMNLHPADPASATAASIQSRESQRKRRRSPETPLESLFAKDPMGNAQLPTSSHDDHRASNDPFHPSQIPMPDLHYQHYTEVPHLERSARPSSRPMSAPVPRKKRLSKRQDVTDRAIRDGQIRALSAMGSQQSYRHSTHGDIVRRDSKKGARSSAKSRADKRDSTASLPVPGSVRSDMSGVLDQNGWEISALNFLNPRPTVRYSGVMHHTSSLPNVMAAQRSGQTPEKLPVVNEHITKRSRNKISDLADDFDASDIRMLMERDRRRREKKKSKDFDKLDESLRRVRADKERAEQISEPADYSNPSAVHPAFRDQTGHDAAAMDQAPLSPVSLQNDSSQTALSSKEQDLEQDPFKDAVQTQPELEHAATAVVPITPALQQASPMPSPGETPFATPGEEHVLGEAEAVAISRAHLTHGALSPPMSPTRPSRLDKQSPLRQEFEPATAAPNTAPVVPAKDGRRTVSAWSQLFRRSGIKHMDNRASTSDMSFSNTSRESMSRQQLPPHLVATQIAPKRNSAAPTRKQSIFREELADSPTTSPNAKFTDVSAPLVNPALTRLQKPSTLSVTPEAPVEPSSAATESPIDVAMTNSLASIDSEGSWLTGRPSVRKSVHSQLRNSTGSLSRRKSEAFNASYEDLGMSEAEYTRQSTFGSPRTDATSVLGDLPDRSEFEEDEAMVKHRDSNRKTPTLVHRDPQYKSREGLVADYLAGATTPAMDTSRPGTAASGRDSPTDPNLMFGGESVEYGRHARQMSTGSAKLLDISRSGSRSGGGAGGAGKRISSEGGPRGFVRPKSMPPL